MIVALTNVLSSVAISLKLPTVKSPGVIGSLKPMTICAFGETLLLLFAGSMLVTCGGVASSFTFGIG